MAGAPGERAGPAAGAALETPGTSGQVGVQGSGGYQRGGGGL